MKTLTGLDSFISSPPRRFRGARAGLLVHPASVNRKLQHAAELFLRANSLHLKAFLGPQHGFYGQTQDNMVEWKGFTDPKTGIPVYSLYGETRKPTLDMLNQIDVLIIDLQDIGARYYTFIWTMDLCMEACCQLGKSVVVLDRPNPIGGSDIEGPVLDMEYCSFVGLKSLPIRHGMTIGEIGYYLHDCFYSSLDFHIIKMKGWQRGMWFDDTRLPWVMPSPNMPTLDTATVYPGMCLFEGTILSEGRGTTKPFEIFGAPFIKPDILIKRLNEFKLPGVVFRPLWFEPTFQKYTGKLCGGAQIHVINRAKFKPFKTAVAILKAVRELYPEYVLWKEPPYEYETVKMPIDILFGTDMLRISIDRGETIQAMEQWWTEQSLTFKNKIRDRYILY
jgi:uncharacterized protein YbbC (DUF1343 family)